MNILDLLTIKEKTNLSYINARKGETLFHEGEQCNAVCIVIDGVINISSVSFNGDVIVFNTILSGGLFGHNLVFSSDPYYKGNVVCKTKCKLAFIEKNKLLYLFQSNTLFLSQYLRIESDFAKRMNSKIKMLSFSKALDRLDYYFYINNNEIKCISISSLANELGLTREATSRLISKEIELGKITKRGHYLIKHR